MAIEGIELEKEKKILRGINLKIQKKIDELGGDIELDEEKIREFKKFAWDNKSSMDSAELSAVTSESMLEANMMLMQKDYFKKLLRVKNSPYFASIVFDDEDNEHHVIYIGLTYLKDDKLRNIINDWRSPICSIYYDYEVGECAYLAPGGIIRGNLRRKRQYKIENKELIRLFDSSLNIEDEMLQEVLASESSEKMKNIVNTIQSEQNAVIRNTTDKNLIVSGIAGSGKTSVALHRIAFLLYKIKHLTSSKVLIFSPNQIFTEYISNVLPELGEDNTLQTTFNDYMSKELKGFKKVENYVDFIGRYYKNGENNKELVFYKQSDGIIKDIENFVNDYVTNAKFTSGFVENEIYKIDKDEINQMLRNRYSSLVLFDRVDTIADKLSEANYKGTHKKSATYRKLLLEHANFTNDFKEIFCLFFKSEYAKVKMTEVEIQKFKNSSEIKYEDALLLTYLKGLLEGFYYERYIEQVVIDEAQDYSYLQYLIISKIFKHANFTILGDVNQTINPYYKYRTLSELTNIFKSSAYIELTKTYRSSQEIIAYTNKILGLNHVCAIRKDNHIPVVLRTTLDTLEGDVNHLRDTYKSIAIITRDSFAANKVYNLLKEKMPISLIESNTIEFNKELVVLPAYIAKGLEFDSVIVYTDKDSYYNNKERNLLYVACTRAQHELIVYSVK
ncbi:MAG: HelD family protein [Bacilli bacterium]